ncbi:helix-hairpin-helix domain-containing protein [Lacticaseibacillus absianus]|uniref:helix-hairpin-helix domain-containing protein n=1 Tax=Lacticaseibacillus absianus TaxID=2729623 RepID=UPI0015C925FF|nr:helix-hairpin-helix domain-containing protein [Lacticaseibacillus absianus]
MDQLKEWVRLYWVVPLVVVAVLGWLWWQARPQPASVEPLTASVSTSTASRSTATSSGSGPQAGVVHLKGAVVHPGLYPVTTTTRWDAVVKAAGGLTPVADITQINLAKFASDQESLYIPSKGEAAVAPAPGASGASAASASGTLVDLNTATEAELQTLSGIGPKKAADIIAYRETSGGFKTVEDLKNVSGIGEKTYERLAPLVTVGP